MSGKACDIVIVGTKTVGGTSEFAMVRYANDGTLDSSFDSNVNAAVPPFSGDTFTPSRWQCSRTARSWWPATTIALTATTSTSCVSCPMGRSIRSSAGVGRPTHRRGRRYQRGHPGQQHDCCRRGISGHGIRHHGFRPGPIRRERRIDNSFGSYGISRQDLGGYDNAR